MSDEKKIVSLYEKARDRNKGTRKQYLDTDTRLRELEDDVFRLIDMVLLQESAIQDYEKRFSKLLRLLADSSFSAVASSAEAEELKKEP